MIAGPERKGRVMNEKTKHTIAYHESGHALVGHLLDSADPVHKISIISRGRALGYTLSIPDDDKVLNTLTEMKDELAVFLGGRVAEEIFCDDITTGASNDLERASKMARAIVTQYGMSELGVQVFGQPNHEVFLGRDYGNTQDYSEETARKIDEQVAVIMKEAHDRAYAILSSHSDQMDLMAKVLLERETVEGEACQALLDNKWDEYLAREGDIIAAKEKEEQEARRKDAEQHPELADPNWMNEHVEPGDQNPNGPFWTPAKNADTSDEPTQTQVDAEIRREDIMSSSPYVIIPGFDDDIKPPVIPEAPDNQSKTSIPLEDYIAAPAPGTLISKLPPEAYYERQSETPLGNAGDATDIAAGTETTAIAKDTDNAASSSKIESIYADPYGLAKDASAENADADMPAEQKTTDNDLSNNDAETQGLDNQPSDDQTSDDQALDSQTPESNESSNQ